MRERPTSSESRVLATAIAIGVAALLAAAPLVQAAGTGSFNYERLYWGSNRGDVYIERAPRLFYNPNAPGDSYEPNGIYWYANMYSYWYWGTKYVPDELYLTVRLWDITSTASAAKWSMARWWPVSTTDFGYSVSWSFSIQGGGDNIQGGISATITGTSVNKVVPDQVGKWSGNTWQAGKLTVDFNAQYGKNQYIVEGAMKLAIRNSDGPAQNGHRYLIILDWQGVWRGCGIAACLGNHRSMSLTMVLGDNSGTGDGYIYVRTGDASGS